MVSSSSPGFGVGDGLARVLVGRVLRDIAVPGGGAVCRCYPRHFPLRFVDPTQVSPCALSRALATFLEVSGGFKDLPHLPPHCLPDFSSQQVGISLGQRLRVPAAAIPLFSGVSTPSRSKNVKAKPCGRRGTSEGKGAGKCPRRHFRTLCLPIMASGV